MTFSELKLTRQFLNAIEDAGYVEPSPIQVQAIPPLRSGQDVIGIAQTGTGKTAAFLLPLLQTLKYAQHNEPRGLVLAPTKELAIQIHNEALKFSTYTDLRILALYGGIGPKTQIEQLNQGCDLIICTPGRFIELYSHGHISTKRSKHLVLDEEIFSMDELQMYLHLAVKGATNVYTSYEMYIDCPMGKFDGGLQMFDRLAESEKCLDYIMKKYPEIKPKYSNKGNIDIGNRLDFKYYRDLYKK